MKKILTIFFLLSVIVLLFYFTGCGRAVEEASSNTEIETETTTQVITSADGGILSFDDGTSLSIPAGALSSDETISIEKPLNLSDLSSPFLNTVYITSESTSTLNTPATLTFKYDPDAVGTNETVIVALSSPANTTTVEGGEMHQLEFISPEAVDDSAGTVTCKLNHFSRAFLWKQKKFYMVFDIPTKYLKKSDILYVLTGAEGSRGQKTNASWLPGHVALYLGTREASGTTNDEDTVIESTRSSNFHGVQFASFAASIKESSHIYMGAYRPKNKQLTTSNRNNIAGNAIAKESWKYTMVETRFALPLGSGSLAGPNGITCVALVEDAYDEAGLSMLSESAEWLLLPLEQFLKTEQVNEISVEVGEAVRIGIVGITSLGRISGYTDDLSEYAINVSSSLVDNGIATLTKAAFDHLLSFTPTTSEAGNSYEFIFSIEAADLGSDTKSFTINVGAASTDEVETDYSDNYFRISSVDPSSGTLVSLEASTAISVTFDYNLTQAVTGTFETGKLLIKAGGLAGSYVSGASNIVERYDDTKITYTYETSIPTGEGSKTCNFSVTFPSTSESRSLPATPFFWARLTRPDASDLNYEGWGAEGVSVSYHREY